MFCSFLGLLRKYKGCVAIEKLPGIIVKCLLKVAKIMPSIIDQINIERVLLATHNYLLAPPLSPNAPSDEVGVRITKTIVNELVKLKRQEIWRYYGGVESHPEPDIYIRRWVEIILKSMDEGQNQQRPYEQEIRQILAKIPRTHEDAKI